MIDVLHDDEGPQSSQIFDGGRILVDKGHRYGGMGSHVAHHRRFVPDLLLKKLYDSYLLVSSLDRDEVCGRDQSYIYPCKNPEGRRRAVFVLEMIVNVVSPHDGLVKLDDLAWLVFQDEIGNGMIRGLVVDGRLPLIEGIIALLPGEIFFGWSTRRVFGDITGGSPKEMVMKVRGKTIIISGWLCLAGKGLT